MKYKKNTILYCIKTIKNNITYQIYTKGCKYRIEDVYENGYVVPDDIDPVLMKYVTYGYSACVLISEDVIDEHFITINNKFERILNEK